MLIRTGLWGKARPVLPPLLYKVQVQQVPVAAPLGSHPHRQTTCLANPPSCLPATAALPKGWPDTAVSKAALLRAPGPSSPLRQGWPQKHGATSACNSCALAWPRGAGLGRILDLRNIFSRFEVNQRLRLTGAVWDRLRSRSLLPSRCVGQEKIQISSWTLGQDSTKRRDIMRWSDQDPRYKCQSSG